MTKTGWRTFRPFTMRMWRADGMTAYQYPAAGASRAPDGSRAVPFCRLAIPAQAGAVRAPAVMPGVAAEVERCLDKRHVAERLRCVPDQPAVPRVELLAEQPDVIPQAEQLLEQFHGLVPLPGQLQGVGEPEAAREERALAAAQPVDRGLPAFGELVP